MGNKNKKIKTVEKKQEEVIKSRNKGIVIGAVACVLLVALIAYLVVPHDKKPEATTSDSAAVEETTTEETTDTQETEETSAVDVEYNITSADDFEPAYYADIDIEDYGTITVALNKDAAPITVDNFVKLANEGFYDGLTFHRIVEGFMMQGGDPEGTGQGGSDETIKGEFANNGVANPMSHVRGAISMARNGVDMDSASSQFFICHEDSDFLNGDYACFGFVTDGMDVVDAVCEYGGPTDETLEKDKQPVIKSIKIRQE